MTCPTPRIENLPMTAVLTSQSDAENEMTSPSWASQSQPERVTSPSQASQSGGPVNGDLHFYMGLKLDGVARYRNLSNSLPQYSELTVYVDPVIEKFKVSPIIYQADKQIHIDVQVNLLMENGFDV